MTPEVPKEVKELRFVYTYETVEMKEPIYVPCNVVVSWTQPSVM